MPTTSPPLIALPPPGVELVGPDGKPTKAFTDWLIRLQAVVTKLRLEIP